MEKRIYRSNTNKMIGGVCAGIGEYFAIDPTFVRILTVLLFFASGFGILAYLVGWIIIPARPSEEVPPEVEYRYSQWSSYLPGIFLIGLGLIFLLRQYWYWFDFEALWPILLIGGGVAFIVYSQRKGHELPESSQSTNNGQTTPEQNGGTAR